MINQFLSKVKTTKSLNTYETYKQSLDYMCPDGNPVFTVDYLLSKINDMHMAGLSRNTVKQRILCYGRLLKYISSKTLVPNMGEILEIISEYKSDSKVQPCPTKEHIEEILSAIDDPKYRSIYLLMCQSGLRVGEVVSLNLADYHGSHVIVRDTKNKQEEIVKVSKSTQQAIDKYIKNHRYATSEKLFTTTHGGIEKSVVQKVIKRYCTMAGHGEYSCHSLRHYFCSYLIEKNITAPIIQSAMRHKTITSTQRYFSINKKQMYDILDQVFE